LYNYNLELTGSELNLFSDWIYSQEMLDKIETVFFNTKDKSEANNISIAYTILLNNNK